MAWIQLPDVGLTEMMMQVDNGDGPLPKKGGPPREPVAITESSEL
jgi:hypothetical protein